MGSNCNENSYDTSCRQNAISYYLITKHVSQIFAVILVELAKSEIFPGLSLPSRKFQLVVNANLAKKLVPNFARWCANPT